MLIYVIRKPALTNVPADTNGLCRRRFYSISPDSISPPRSDSDNVKPNPDSRSPLKSSPSALDLSQQISEMKNNLASPERKDVIYPDNLNIREANNF